MTRKKLHRIFQQLQRVAVSLPLIEELRLVVPAETGHPQLALRVIRQHPAPKHDDCGIEYAVMHAQSEPVEHIRGVSGDGSRHSAGSRAEPQCPQDLLPIQVLQGHCGRQVLPALLSVRSLQEKALVCLLRHHRCCRSDAFIGPAVESERAAFVRWVCL